MKFDIRRLGRRFSCGELRPWRRGVLHAVVAVPDVGGSKDRCFVEELTRTRELLGELTAMTEREFVAVGQKLETLSTVSAPLRRLAEGLSAEITGVDATCGASSLFARAERQARNAISELRSVGDVLAALRSEFQQLGRRQQELRSTIAPLRFVSTQFRIQGCRMDDSIRSVFSILSGDIDRITLQIETVIDQHCDQIKQAYTTLQRLDDEVTSAERAFAATMMRPLQEARSAIDAWETTLQQALGASAELRERGSSIERLIHQIVVALQVQDIVRQEMEHMDSAIGEIASELVSVDDSENSRSGRLYVALLSEIQQRHAKSVVARLDEAGDTISSSMESFRKGAMEVAETAVQVARITLDGETIYKAMQSLREITQISEATGKLVKGVLEALMPLRAQVQNYTRSIASLAAQVRLSALNAQISAAQDERASALGVLAEASCRISDETIAQSSMFSELMDRLRASVESTRERLQLHLTDESRETVQLRENIHSLQALLRGLEEQLPKTVLELDELKAKVEPLAAVRQEQFEFPTHVAQVRELLPPMFGQLVLWAREHAGDVTLNEVHRSKLSTLESSYTVAEERSAHQRVLQAAANADVSRETDATVADECDLFDDPAALADVAENASAVSAPAGEFGDNIELF